MIAQSHYPVHVLLSPVIQMFTGLSTSLPLLLGNVLFTLFSHPKQINRYISSAKSSVNELMRFAGPVQLIYRLTVTEASIGNHRFSRGDRIALVLAHANQDSARFRNAETLNLNRNTAAHLSFGKRKHSCAGAPIIRKALEIIPRYVLTHFSNMELCPANIKWGGSPTIQGITALPVLIH